MRESRNHFGGIRKAAQWYLQSSPKTFVPFFPLRRGNNWKKAEKKRGATNWQGAKNCSEFNLIVRWTVHLTFSHFTWPSIGLADFFYRLQNSMWKTEANLVASKKRKEKRTTTKESSASMVRPITRRKVNNKSKISIWFQFDEFLDGFFQIHSSNKRKSEEEILLAVLRSTTTAFCIYLFTFHSFPPFILSAQSLYFFSVCVSFVLSSWMMIFLFAFVSQLLFFFSISLSPLPASNAFDALFQR